MKADAIQRFVKFCLVGLAGTAAHFATMAGLIEMAYARPVAATTAGFFVGMVVNYLLNYRFTFASNRPHAAALPKFVSIGVGTGILNASLVFLGADVLGFHYFPVQVVATGAVFILNFLLNSIWTFRDIE